jgi:hypothetical protein
MRTKPKSKWHLVSVAVSPEAAIHDVNETLKQAQKEGNEQAEVVFQVFESSFWIPHYLNEVKDQKPLFN